MIAFTNWQEIQLTLTRVKYYNTTETNETSGTTSTGVTILWKLRPLVTLTIIIIIIIIIYFRYMIAYYNLPQRLQRQPFDFVLHITVLSLLSKTMVNLETPLGCLPW